MPRSDVVTTPEQEREIDRLRSMAYVAGRSSVAKTVGVTVHLEGKAQPGLNLAVDTHGPEAVLMDMSGKVVHTWKHDFRAAFPESSIRSGAEGIQYWRRVALLEGGGLLAIFEGAGLVRLRRDSSLVWAFEEAVHHDLEVQPDGSIYVLTREASLRPEIHRERPVTEDWVVVLGPDGEVRRRVSILESIRTSDFNSLIGLTAGHGDLLHTNTLEVLDGRLTERVPAFARGNVLLSFPKIDTVAVLDMESETISWSLTGMTGYQHEPTVLDSGRLMIFDNWGGVAAKASEATFSRVVEVDPVKRSVEWSIDGRDYDFFTECCGANQRLENGNTLITETDRGRAFEITREGEIVWEYRTPHRVGEAEQELVARLFEVRRFDASDLAWLPER